MKAIEFINLGIVPETKVRVKHATHAGSTDTNTTDCYFMGYWKLGSGSIITSLDWDIMPHFHEIGKNGRPGKKEVLMFINFQRIVSIEPID